MEQNKPKVTYNESVKKAIYKYREKNIQKYNEKQREYYSEAVKDEDWRKKFNERCKINNKVYRDKKKELSNEVKPRGRPRKEIKFSAAELIKL
jgi:hypothetical protein